MKIVVAFDTFKGCVNGYEASEYVASRLTEHGAEAYALPLADGGEGTARALALLYGGTPVDVETVDAYGAPTEARVYLLPEGVAAVDMASCVGLGAAEGTSRARVMEASSYGLGLLLRRLTETHRPASVLLGAGGSASCDGATGLLAALGVRLRFRTHTPMRPAGRHLAAVEGLEKLGAAKGQADRAAQISGDACHPRRDKHRIRQIRCAADRRTGTSGDGGCIPYVVPMAVGDKNHVRVHLLCPFRTASPGEEGVRQDFVDAVIQQKAGMAQKLQLHICSTPFSKMGRTAVRASVGRFS